MRINKGRGAAVLALCSLALGTAGMAQDEDADLSCEIRATAEGGGVRLEAVATAGISIAGDYDFVIARSGPGGSSDIRQGGTFDIAAGEEAVLGEATLGGDAGAVEASLTLTPAGNRPECRAEYPSRS